MLLNAIGGLKVDLGVQTGRMHEWCLQNFRMQYNFIFVTHTAYSSPYGGRELRSPF